MCRPVKSWMVRTASAGPPHEKAALIFALPSMSPGKVGTGTQESRGIETIWADFRSAGMWTRMIVSLRCAPGVQVPSCEVVGDGLDVVAVVGPEHQDVQRLPGVRDRPAGVVVGSG